jgi:hypothetical protein
MRYSVSLTAAALFCLAVFHACHLKHDTPLTPVTPMVTKPTPGPMPTLPVFSDYLAEWKIIDSLEEQGLFKRANESTMALYLRSLSDKNPGQQLKALLYRAKYATLLGEEGLLHAIELMQSQMDGLGQPEKSVAQSQLATLYQRFLTQNAWTIRERTPIPGKEGQDIRTWSAAQFEGHILDLFRSSLAEERLLQSYQADFFAAIISQGLVDTLGFPLRTNLFDFLAFRALEYLKDDRSYLNEPAQAFVVDGAWAFAEDAVFAATPITHADTTSNRFRAVQVLQRLTKRQQDATVASTAALIDVALARLEFMRQVSVHPDKALQYRDALKSLHARYHNHPSDAEIVSRQVESLLAESDDPTKANRRQAAAWCLDAIRKYPGTYGAGLCQQLLNGIQRTNLVVTAETAYLPEAPVLYQLEWTNLKKIYTRVVAVDVRRPWDEGQTFEEKWQFLRNRKALHARDWDLADPGDFYGHTTELMLPPCPLGRYVLMVADNPDFSPESGLLTWSEFYVTRMANLQFNESGRQGFVVMDRQTGAPLSGVKLQFIKSDYNYRTRRYDRVDIGKAVTDANGWASRTGDADESGEVWLSKGKDTLPGRSFYIQRSEREQAFHQLRFFTDRNLYRPGQTVYFKGVLFRRDGRGIPSVIAGERLKVQFRDANGQVKGSLQLTTNAFGSIQGSFTAPASGLTGRMHIHAEGIVGEGSFQVEEYKRPKFEVVMAPIEGSFRLQDTIRASGQARAYAGSAVDGATATYRVVRTARFPYWDWGYFRRPIPWERQEKEIARGTVGTDAAGKFVVPFPALPDPTVPISSQPVFDFAIRVSVTDINGEVREVETRVSVGYVALNLNLDLAPEAPLGSFHKVTLTTTNLAGGGVASRGSVVVEPLKTPGYIFHERYWAAPDVWTLPKSVYRRDFPRYAWQQEDDPSKWPLAGEGMVLPYAGSGRESLDLSAAMRAPGVYRISVRTQDDYGTPVVLTRVVRVWEETAQTGRFLLPEAAAVQSVCEPGSQFEWNLGSSLGELMVFTAREKAGRLEGIEWRKVGASARYAEKITEADRGGSVWHWGCVRDNRLYGRQTIAVQVPWTNKQLNLQFETFRDKLSPGQEEVWKLKISGPDGERVGAELVAALYDASLDQFAPHNWQTIGHFLNGQRIYRRDGLGFEAETGSRFGEPMVETELPARTYPDFEWFRMPFWGLATRDGIYTGVAATAQKMRQPEAAAAEEASITQKKEPETGVADGATPQKPAPAPPASVRTNLKETVFFYPELQTDEAGNVLLKFRMNEALTRWKLMLYGHTADFKEAYAERTVVTQKPLMVLANPPRFLRAGDTFEFAAKVSNLSDVALNGTAQLQVVDAVTLESVASRLGLAQSGQPFQLEAGRSAGLSWLIRVPADFNGAVIWQLVADGGAYRDGEESILPVVTNRMLVTESIPMTVRGNESRSFEWSPSTSPTRQPHKYTLEFSSNPAWYVVQALPYLMDFPHECSEQVFSRYYANALAASVTRKLPNIRRVYEQWKGTDEMASPLSKNQDLKYALLEETPWVFEANQEEQQKQQIALLFDLNRMAAEEGRALRILQERQTENGGWPWFGGGQESWHVTQYIAEGLGHLERLGGIGGEHREAVTALYTRAIAYCEAQVNLQYRELENRVKEKKTRWEDDHLTPLIIHYLYTRSFKSDEAPSAVFSYYLDQAKRHWLKKGLYQEGMLALVLHRYGQRESAQAIVRSLRERAQVKPEIGMYWAADWGYRWFELPVETQALMVEVFAEVAEDAAAVENLRIWLLKNKQTNRWESTTATAKAVYALLLKGDNWLEKTIPVEILLGRTPVQPAEIAPGTGYFRQNWRGEEIKKDWNRLEVKNPNGHLVWGAAYRQYFEDLDKITGFRKTPLTIDKRLFRVSLDAQGPVLSPLAEGQVLKVGDKVRVRIEIRVDRDMEYVHLKDMRAAGFEPVNVLSGYRWSGGLGYYESTKDLASHFFFDYLPTGVYVFEYDVLATHRGDMSNGITTMQCMYAPEFTTHSVGIRVKVE